jgi:hypothetical protein
MRLAAVMPSPRRIRRFLRPLENRQLRAVAVHHKPVERLVALLAANFTSINGIDQS